MRRRHARTIRAGIIMARQVARKERLGNVYRDGSLFSRAYYHTINNWPKNKVGFRHD